MRLLAAPLVVAAVAAALAAADDGGRGRPLTLTARMLQTAPLAAFAWSSEGARVVRLDARSLRPRGPRTRQLGYVDTWALARPGRRLLAVAASPDSNGNMHDAIRLVQLSNLRLLPKRVPLGGSARALLWARPDRLVAVVGDCCAPGMSVVTVDAGARRVVSTAPLAGSVQVIARADEKLVLLETPLRGIGESRLDVVGADGAMQSVALDRVRAGTSFPQDVSADPIGTIRMPAVAVDPAGSRAYVVQPDGPAAEIDLRTLAVSYHDLVAPRSVLDRLSAWLMPAASAKGVSGPERRGLWLGDGLVAVTGSDQAVRTEANGYAMLSGTPSGLAIVDTRAWTTRMLDPGADAVSVAGDLLLATGRVWSSDARQPTGMGLAAYGSDRKLRFRLFAGSASWVEFVLGGRAYVVSTVGTNVSKLAVVDLASGRVVGKRGASLPTPILGDGPTW